MKVRLQLALDVMRVDDEVWHASHSDTASVDVETGEHIQVTGGKDH